MERSETIWMAPERPGKVRNDFWAQNREIVALAFPSGTKKERYRFAFGNIPCVEKLRQSMSLLRFPERQHNFVLCLCLFA